MKYLSSDDLLNSYINIHWHLLVDQTTWSKFWAKIMVSHSSRDVYHKLNRALADGADVTIVWIQTIVIRAKQQWQVKSLQVFLKNLQALAAKRGIALHADVMRLTKNCWLYVGT